MLLASVALWRSESHRSIMHCAKAFLLIKFMFCLLLRLMSFYPWILRSTRLSTLSIAFNFFLHPSQASPSIYWNPSIIPALQEQELLSSWFSGTCGVWGLSPSFPSWPASWCFFMRNSVSWSSPLALWSCSPEFYCGRYNRALRHQHDYTVFFYLKNAGQHYCCSATWNCVSLLASLNFKNIFLCQLK